MQDGSHWELRQGIRYRGTEGVNGLWTWSQANPTGSEVALPVEPEAKSPPRPELNQRSRYLKSRLLQGVTPEGESTEKWIAATVMFMKHVAMLTNQPELLPGLANQKWTDPRETMVAAVNMWQRAEVLGLVYEGDWAPSHMLAYGDFWLHEQYKSPVDRQGSIYGE